MKKAISEIVNGVHATDERVPEGKKRLHANQRARYAITAVTTAPMAARAPATFPFRESRSMCGANKKIQRKLGRKRDQIAARLPKVAESREGNTPEF